MSSPGHGTKAVIAALLANLGIAVAKFVGFLLTRSSSMLAESVHSLADSGNQALLLFGGRRARRDPTPTHQFGYGRERYFWAFVVALVLFMLGSLFAIYEGIEKIRHPHEVDSLGIAIGILVLGLLLEGNSFRTAVSEANLTRGNASWWEFIKRTRSPELPVVLLEDLGALIGLVIALTAVTVSAVTDHPVWDGIGTLTIGVLLGIIAVVLAVETRSMLLGESARPETADDIAAAMTAHPDVAGVIHMRTEHLGPDELLVAAKLAFDPSMSMSRLADVIDEVEVAVRDAAPQEMLIYLEPDLRRTDTTST